MLTKAGRQVLVGTLVTALIVAGGVGIYATFFAPGPAPPACALECGGLFAAGNPVAGNCSEGEHYEANGCSSGDATFNLTVEQSTFAFGGLHFKVVIGSTNDVATMAGSGGFTVRNPAGVIVALSDACDDERLRASGALGGQRQSAHHRLHDHDRHGGAGGELGTFHLRVRRYPARRRC
jgi:hypothetical protein